MSNFMQIWFASSLAFAYICVIKTCNLFKNTTKIMMKHRHSLRHFILLALLVLLFQPLLGQKKNLRNLVEIEIVPNHPDWTYEVGEDVNFTLRVVRENVALTDVELVYTIAPEKCTPFITDTIVVASDEVCINAGTMRSPGFMTCTCSVVVDGKEYGNYINVAFSPHKIAPTQTNPKDFDSFWRKSLAKAAKIPLEPLITLVPEKCTPRTNVYHVRLQHWRKGTYMYGWLCVPKKEGKYPAVLCLPGAGVKPVPAEVELAEMGDGLITFSMGVNGIPLTLDKEVYDNLRYGVLKDYGYIHLDSKEHYYYRRIYTGCVRAIDFITTLDQYDGANLGVAGASQGGALSIVTAALDKRVKALAAFYPALCDVTGYLHGRAGGWPHIFSPSKMELNNTPEKIATTQYYDVVNFARRLQAPGYYSWGYNDATTPPTSCYAAYNVIAAPKQLFLARATAHWRLPEQNEIVYGWLYKTLTNTK